ncbi:response regulator [bacterium]|nr:response regulator [bacterium]
MKLLTFLSKFKKEKSSAVKAISSPRTVLDFPRVAAEANISRVATEASDDERIALVVEKLAHDAQVKGAAEVFIGHPDKASYEFVVGSKCYRGKIHPSVYQTLAAYFNGQHRLERSCNESQVLKKICISLTRNFEHPVLCLSWELLVPESPELSAPEILAGPYAQATDETAALPTVLLVDDDLRLLMVLSKIFESKSFTVVTEHISSRALERLNRGEVQADLVIADVHMPNLDGPKFLHELRQGFPDLPVIMLTSDMNSLIEAELALLGADAFVRKQEDPKILLAWAKNLLLRKYRMKTKRAVEELAA